MTPNWPEKWSTSVRYPLVNVLYWSEYFSVASIQFFNSSFESKPTLHQFRKQLAFALIDNKFVVRDEEEKKVTRSTDGKKHVIRTAPKHARKFEHGKWEFGTKTPYQQYACRGENCKSRTRTYCSCSPKKWMCKECFLSHVYSVFCRFKRQQLILNSAKIKKPKVASLCAQIWRYST